jgi:predicted nucleic acid-binding protein
VILVDANILMYAAGRDHPNKTPSLAVLESVATEGLDAAIDAEILQEILHRYRAIGRWDDGRRVFDAARNIFGSVLPITSDILDVARRRLDQIPRLSARDALHAAVVEVNELEGICSFDTDFDNLPGIARIDPARLAQSPPRP